MNNIKYKLSLLSIAILIMFGSCESLDLDVNTDPNNAYPEDSDIQLLLNGTMVDFSAWIGEEDDDNRVGFEAGMEIVRMLHAYGPLYENAYEPGDFDDIWRQAYAGHLNDIKVVKQNASAVGFTHHLGIAQVLESYTLTTLVDYFGDVPYSEAIQGSDNPSPSLDDDQEVYDIALNLLNEAITNLNDSPATTITSTGDLFYGGDVSKWITLAKTLKLRIYNNTRLVNPDAQDEINTLLTENDLIDTEAEDFQVFYGTNVSAPDTRHPQFINNYQNSPSGEYMSMYFMNLMVNDFDDVDPRTRYYFYRQVSEFPPNNAQGVFDFPCLAESYPSHYTPGVDPFCTSIGDGYWGRIHFDAQGLPSDQDKITTWGTYPAGGSFDNDSFEAVNQDSGMKGNGIQPVLLSSFVDFMRAEAALTLNTDDDAAAMLESGIRASINKVINFDTSTLDSSYSPSTTDVDDYVNNILDDFNNTANPDEKLNIVMTQAYIASWGNPVEAYNNYRRTGMPLNIQPAQTATPGAFIRSFKYPSVAINNNPNISPKQNQTVKVFWDTNSANLDF